MSDAQRTTAKWSRIALIALSLLAAASSAYVEIQFGEANKEIPDGIEHDEAWKTYHRLRQCNRATLAISGVAAALAVGATLAGGSTRRIDESQKATH